MQVEFDLDKQKKKQPDEENDIVPREIDSHYEIYGKHVWEAEYTNERCPTCNRRIDDFGFCACGAGM